MHIPNNLTNNVGYVMSTSEVMRGHSDQQRLEIGQHWKIHPRTKYLHAYPYGRYKLLLQSYFEFKCHLNVINGHKIVNKGKFRLFIELLTFIHIYKHILIYMYICTGSV